MTAYENWLASGLFVMVLASLLLNVAAAAGF